jgi:hypothetical protein
MYSTSDLDLATRHVEEGQARVEKLREFIMRLELNGHSTDQVEQLLDTFECILARPRYRQPVPANGNGRLVV